MEFIGLNWSSLIVYLALALIGIWVCYSFLNKKGLYLFGVLAVAVCFGAFPYTAVSVFSRPISINVVIMPVVYLALLTCFYKHGKEETKKLFFAILIAMGTLFICKFLEAAYLDSYYKAQVCLTWSYLGSFIGTIIAFAAASALTLFLTTKINVKSLQNFLKLAVYLFIASAIDVVVYIILVYTGSMSFGNILLTLLIALVLLAVICLLLGYFEKFFNRKPAPEKSAEKQEEKQVEKKEAVEPAVAGAKVEENTQNEQQAVGGQQQAVSNGNNEEISTPDDID